MELLVLMGVLLCGVFIYSVVSFLNEESADSFPYKYKQMSGMEKAGLRCMLPLVLGDIIRGSKINGVYFSDEQFLTVLNYILQGDINAGAEEILLSSTKDVKAQMERLTDHKIRWNSKSKNQSEFALKVCLITVQFWEYVFSSGVNGFTKDSQTMFSDMQDNEVTVDDYVDLIENDPITKYFEELQQHILSEDEETMDYIKSFNPNRFLKN